MSSCRFIITCGGGSSFVEITFFVVVVVVAVVVKEPGMADVDLFLACSMSCMLLEVTLVICWFVCNDDIEDDGKDCIVKRMSASASAMRSELVD